MNCPHKNSLLLLKIHVVDFLTKKCGLDYSEDEVFRMLGIIGTNGVHIDIPNIFGGYESGNMVYPTVSYLSHACASNARCW